MKKLTALAVLAATLTLSAFAGDVTVGWDTYQQGTNNLVVDQIKVYAVPGTNTTFTAGNANARVVQWTSVTNTTMTVTNLGAGPWTFVATARVNSANIESDNSNIVWTMVPLKGVVNLKINGVNP